MLVRNHGPEAVMAGASATVTATGTSAPHAFQTNGLTHPLQARGSLQALPKSKQERSGSTEGVELSTA